MSTIVETHKAPPIQKETTVGNYFVSNYPPFSFWKPEFTPQIFDAIEKPPRANTPVRTGQPD